MAKKIILKLADVQVYRRISPNYDNSERFDAFALTIQEGNLRELLGDAFYYALYNDLDASGNPQNTLYTNLVNGETYTHDGDTVEYYGLKPYLSYLWLALNNTEGDVFQAEYGNILYNDNPQDNMVKTTQKQIDRLHSSYMKQVTAYRNNIVKYLNEQGQSVFEHWDSQIEDKPKTQFNIITV